MQRPDEGYGFLDFTKGVHDTFEYSRLIDTRRTVKCDETVRPIGDLKLAPDR